MKEESKWDGLKAISNFLASVLIPLVILIGSNSFSKAIKEKEMRLSYVKMAVNILQQEPDEENAAIRNWAIEIINKYSEVKMDEETAKGFSTFRLPIGDAPR